MFLMGGGKEGGGRELGKVGIQEADTDGEVRALRILVSAEGCRETGILIGVIQHSKEQLILFPG